MSDDRPVDPVVVEVNTETATKETPKRARPHWKCRATGHHMWGYPDDSYKRKTHQGVQVCLRGWGTMGGQCPGIRPVVVPDLSPPPKEAALPTFYLPVSEILRLRKHDWGVPLLRGEDEHGVFWVKP